ncbi:DUF6708 domain-containing protein [Pseudomonas purpurea]|uniref:DUF6708 domain-containing protein n=1 Tax=Pseudomonas purpurea TaxID=3136737 RepID=UPI00326606BB
MSLNKLRALLSEKLSGNNPSAILHAYEPTGQPPMSLFDIEEHKEHYLTIASSDGTYRGMLTGALAGVGGLGFAVLAFLVLLDGKLQPALMTALVAALLFIVPFLWEVFRPLPPPILFNRRTREVYFQHDGDLYHTPWDGIAAAAYEFEMVGPYTGGTRHASLEVLVQCFGHPEKQLLISLGLPMAKSLKLQESFWEYLRSYMNNGPWFDENGHHSESDTFVKGQLEIADSAGKVLRNTWNFVASEYKAADGKNFLDLGSAIMLICAVFLQPMNSIHDFTYSVVKLRNRKRWPTLVTERLRPDGPTTRLIDIEPTQVNPQQSNDLSAS